MQIGPTQAEINNLSHERNRSHIALTCSLPSSWPTYQLTFISLWSTAGICPQTDVHQSQSEPPVNMLDEFEQMDTPSLSGHDLLVSAGTEPTMATVSPHCSQVGRKHVNFLWTAMSSALWYGRKRLELHNNRLFLSRSRSRFAILFMPGQKSMKVYLVGGEMI